MLEWSGNEVPAAYYLVMKLTDKHIPTVINWQADRCSVRGFVLASFSGSHAPEREHLSCAGAESLVFLSHEKRQR